MNFRFSRRACLVIVSVMLLIFLGGCVLVTQETTNSTAASTGATTEPNTTATQTMAPTTSVTEPATSIPETTVPETTATVPETTAPTVPPQTEPIVTEPQPTEPQPTEPQPTEPEPTFPELSAENSFVYDTRSDEFLYLSCDQYTAIYPASITKLFTTYVALQYLDMDTYVTVGDERDMVIWDASVAELKRGDTLTVETLAKCALLVSGCDASYTLAAAAGRAMLGDENASTAIAVQTFMTEVNQRAALLGMINTRFETPDGNHSENHYISMQAFVIIAKCCMENAELAKIAGTYKCTVSITNNATTRTMTLKNSNELLNPNNAAYYLPDALGLKTGYTNKAGACLLSTIRVDGGYLIIGIFGCPTWDSRYPDVLALLKWLESA